MTVWPAFSRNRRCSRIDTCAPPRDSRCWSPNITTCTAATRGSARRGRALRTCRACGCMSCTLTPSSDACCMRSALLGRLRQHRRQLRGEVVDVAGLEQVAVLAVVHEVRQRDRVRRRRSAGRTPSPPSSRSTAARRSRRSRTALAPVRSDAQLLVGGVAVEVHAIADAELVGELLEVAALVAAADDVEASRRARGRASSIARSTTSICFSVVRRPDEHEPVGLARA